MTFFQKLLKKPLLQKLVPYFFFVTTILIMVLNDTLGDSDEFIVFCLVFFTSTAVWMIRWVIVQVKFILRLKKEKTQAELMHLKSQVNPHFFSTH